MESELEVKQDKQSGTEGLESIQFSRSNASTSAGDGSGNAPNASSNFWGSNEQIKQLKQWQSIANDSPQAQYAATIQKMADESHQVQAAKATQDMVNQSSQTGLPEHLKSGVEQLSGISMDDVQVHYNSAKPAQLQAHAYAEGTDIHLASGQEEHLPHEAWHVVQQKQGRVKPTVQMKGGQPVNDDVHLEREADVMGAKALKTTGTEQPIQKKSVSSPVAQGVFLDKASDQFTGNMDDEVLEEFLPYIQEFYDVAGSDNLDWRHASEVLWAVINLEMYGSAYATHRDDATREVIQGIIKEAKIIRNDLEYGLHMKWLKETGHQWTNYNELDAAVRGMIDRVGRYQVIDTTEISYVPRFLNIVNMDLRNIESEVKGENEDDQDTAAQKLLGYEWGDEHGVVSQDMQLYLQDFDNIKAFLSDKAKVITHLIPLSQALEGSVEGGFLTGLKEVLGQFETAHDFPEHPVIPMGLLPSEVFEQLIQDGEVLDDYGAGLRHGELTHRIQWNAIMQAYDDGALQLTHSPIDVYKQSAKPARGGSSKWGEVFDDGNFINADSYSSPGTLNRDLQHSTGRVNNQTNEPALPPRADYEDPDNLGSLMNIGNALEELRAVRLQEMIGKRGPLPESFMEGRRLGQDLSATEQPRVEAYRGIDPTEIFPLPELVDDTMDGLNDAATPYSLWGTGEVGSEFNPNQQNWSVYKHD